MSRRAFLLGTAGLLLLGGCHRHVVHSLAVPPAPPEIRPVMVSVPPPTHPTEPVPQPDVSSAEPVKSVPPPPKKPRRKKVSPAPVIMAPPTVAMGPPPSIELGQLSAGGEAGNNLRGETEGMLAAQKQRIDRLPASVAAVHTAEVEQARRFLKGAEDAWKTGDIEGAHTLVVKAKVLLDDLSK